MKKTVLYLLITVIATVAVAFAQVAIEPAAVGPVNYVTDMFAASGTNVTSISLSGESDSDSTGVYYHEPFTALLLHVVVTDSAAVIVKTHGGIAKHNMTYPYLTDNTKFYFATPATEDTITASGNYHYPATISQAQHIYWSFEAMTGNGIVTLTGDVVRRKFQ